MASLQMEWTTAVPEVQSAAPCARLHAVTKRYGQTLALDGIDLALYPGEIVALLGPNGAGKSTAVRLMLGLSAPTAGTVQIFGRDPRDPAARTRIGAMLQVGSAPEMLRVREHLDLFRGYYPRPLPPAELVRIARLEELMDRKYGELSGGQKQRVMFALALAGDPDIVFLDEPTVGLDIDTRRSLWDEVRALAARGKTVLLTTHYLEEADALATRVVVIDKGRVLREGTPAQIKRLDYTRVIRCRTELSPAELRAIPGVVSAEETAGLTVLEVDGAERVLRLLLMKDATLAELEVLTPALEDAFLAITRSCREEK